jgi:hypothetical protein
VGISHVEPYGLVPGTWAYSGFGSIMAADAANFEPWNSAVHGHYVPALSPQPMYDMAAIQDFLNDLNSLLDAVGLPSWESVAEMARALEAMFGQEFWLNPSGLPYPRLIPSPEAVAVPRPVNLPDPEVPHALNNDFAMRVNDFTRKNDGFRKRNEKNRRERKGKVERGLWQALTAFGEYSEMGDAVNAIWKALPKSVQREAFKRNGYRHLLWEQKMLYITANMNQVDWGEAIPRVILGQIDDFVSAHLHKGDGFYHGKWTARMVSRRAWKDLHEGSGITPPNASVERWLEDNGWLERK